MFSNWLYSLVTAVLLSATVQTQVQAQSTRGWLLCQRFYYYGSIKTKVSPRGSMTETKDLNIYLMPDSSGFVFNRQNRKYCTMNSKVWMSKFGAQQTLGPIVKGPAATYCKHHVQQYSAVAYDAKTKRPEYTLEFSTTEDFKDLPKKIVSDFSTLCGVPGGYGMPLRVFRIYGYPHGTREMFLETSLIQPVDMAAADFQPPVKKYLKVSDEMDVLLAEGDDEMSKLLSDTAKAPNAAGRPKPAVGK